MKHTQIPLKLWKSISVSKLHPDRVFPLCVGTAVGAGEAVRNERVPVPQEIAMVPQTISESL